MPRCYLPRILYSHLLLVVTLLLIVAVQVTPALAVEALEALHLVDCLLALHLHLLCGLGRGSHHNTLTSTLNDDHASGDGPSETLLLSGLLLSECDLLGFDGHLHEGNLGDLWCNGALAPRTSKSRILLLQRSWCLFLGPLGAAGRVVRIVIVHQHGKATSHAFECHISLSLLGSLGLLVGLDALQAVFGSKALRRLRIASGEHRAVLDGVAHLLAVAALLRQQCGAHRDSILVLRPMASIFLSRLACILADLAAGFHDDLVDAGERHCLFGFIFC